MRLYYNQQSWMREIFQKYARFFVISCTTIILKIMLLNTFSWFLLASYSSFSYRTRLQNMRLQLQTTLKHIRLSKVDSLKHFKLYMWKFKVVSHFYSISTRFNRMWWQNEIVHLQTTSDSQAVLHFVIVNWLLFWILVFLKQNRCEWIVNMCCQCFASLK